MECCFDVLFLSYFCFVALLTTNPITRALNSKFTPPDATHLDDGDELRTEQDKGETV